MISNKRKLQIRKKAEKREYYLGRLNYNTPHEQMKKYRINFLEDQAIDRFNEAFDIIMNICLLESDKPSTNNDAFNSTLNWFSSIIEGRRRIQRWHNMDMSPFIYKETKTEQ